MLCRAQISDEKARGCQKQRGVKAVGCYAEMTIKAVLTVGVYKGLDFN